MKSYPIHIPYPQEPWPEFFITQHNTPATNAPFTSIAETKIVTDKYARSEYTLTTFGNGFITKKHDEFVFGWN